MQQFADVPLHFMVLYDKGDVETANYYLFSCCPIYVNL